jgi:hypothetical protein
VSANATALRKGGGRAYKRQGPSALRQHKPQQQRQGPELHSGDAHAHPALPSMLRATQHLDFPRRSSSGNALMRPPLPSP